MTLAVMAAVLALAGCGGDGSGGSPDEPDPFDPEEVLNHYLCHRVSAEGFAKPKGTVELTDQFSAADPEVTVTTRFDVCNPVRKNQFPSPARPGAHLVCYGIEGASADKEVVVSNQFDRRFRGPQQLKVGGPTRTCLPSGKTEDLEPPEPPSIPDDVDHFRCYAASARKAFRPFGLLLRDQFFSGDAKVVRLLEICNPTDKAIDGKPKAKRRQPEAHLACYELDMPKNEESSALIVNQFEKNGALLTVRQPRDLCVPSTKKVVAPPPGG